MPVLAIGERETAVERELVLGRHSSSGLVIEDAKASRRHARVFADEGAYYLEDLNSSNGTLLNGKAVSAKLRLKDGDKILIGKKEIVFRDAAAKAPAVAPGFDAVKLLGREIGGYRLDQLLGSGLLGAVYQATQLSMNRKVAVKIFDPDLLAQDKAWAERFIKEARKLGSLVHENLVQVHECGQDKELLWYSMELVEGKTLQQLLERDDTLEPTLALLVVQRAADALFAAHSKGVLHRDVRPGNIMLTEQGGIKILDLGLTEVLSTQRDSRAESASLGSVHYMAPEQTTQEKIDHRADIYSLGCTLYHLLAGRPPYDEKTARAVIAAHLSGSVPSLRNDRPDLPEKIDEIVQCMLNKNPEWRYSSMREVSKEIKAVHDSLQQVKEVKSTLSDRHNVPTAMQQVRKEKIAQRFAQQSVLRHAKFLLILVVIAIVVSFALPNMHTWIDGFGTKKPANTPSVKSGPVKEPTLAETRARNRQERDGDLLQRWNSIQAQVERDLRDNQWGSAERRVKQFAVEAAADQSVADSVKFLRTKLQVDGAQWYRAQIAALPDIRDAKNIQQGLLTKCLTELNHLRDLTLAENRADAESRYQEVLSRLLQQLGTVRRQARKELEEGRPKAIEPLVKGLEGIFRDTPVAGVYRQFAALTAEAAAAPIVSGVSWTSTMESLRKVRGPEALAAGAALILGGDPETGKQVLFREPLLESGDLSVRREAMLGREAAVLSFNDITDLQFIETIDGEPQFSGGALTGPSGAACGIACSVPVGGDSWDAKLVMNLEDVSAGEDDEGGQAVLGCWQKESVEFLVRVEREKLVIRVHAADGWQEQSSPLPALTPLSVRILCRAGRLQVTINDEAVFECDKSAVPSKSQLRFEVNGMRWSLEELQVIGAE
jgi:serine/threonine protein kinase